MKKFLSSYPELVKEWHPTKNGDLTPNDFTHGSNKKVWWKCNKGHDYESAISGRTRKGSSRGCSYCSGKKVSEENSLLELFPSISQEWHSTKNGDLTPKDFTCGTNKKVWWRCQKGHEYEAAISNRTKLDKPTGCPYCSGRYPTKERNLLVLFPDVSKEWNSYKNGNLVPEYFSVKSNQKVWWRCQKGHEYESVIANRTKLNKPTGCPYCSGKRPSEENNLVVFFPNIAKEWHPTKNDNLTPKDFTSKSGSKVWWMCAKGHSYELVVRNRTNKNRGCPYCLGIKDYKT